MKIFKECITGLANECRLSLQVPQVFLGNGTEMEVPDTWFMHLEQKNGKYVKSNPKKGFTFLSAEGFEANKEEIKSAFSAAAKMKGSTDEQIEGYWDAFLVQCQRHFDELERLGATMIV